VILASLIPICLRAYRKSLHSSRAGGCEYIIVNTVQSRRPGHITLIARQQT
jgi:hypothetical protein